MKNFELSKKDFLLIDIAIQHIEQNFKPKQHHVASVIRSRTGKLYKALHLDIQGFDVCAEAIALSMMMADEKGTDIHTIVAVLKQGEQTGVINPCGNCRQMILQYSPNAYVIVAHSGKFSKVRVKELLPYPY